MPIPANGMIIEKTTVGMPRKDALAGEINAVSMFYFPNTLINNNRNNSATKARRHKENININFIPLFQQEKCMVKNKMIL